MRYRLYADGTLVHEDDFSEYDNAQPYYDDYAEEDISVPDEIEGTDEGEAYIYTAFMNR